MPFGSARPSRPMVIVSMQTPQISVVVVIYRMPSQVRNTLLSLSSTYQTNVSTSDYEVLVIENASDRLLGREAVLECGPNFRYFLRDDESVSPVNAVNFGVGQARNPIVGIIIDGARMLTPGVLRHALAAYRITSNAVVAVPGYHLGNQLQQEAAKSSYDERAEAALLKQIRWPEDGYRLFEIACFSGTCVGGYFRPILESNCIFVPRQVFKMAGGCDPNFDLAGGGFVNLDLYKRLCEMPGTTLFMLLGEGTFHQFHGGVTTSATSKEEREAYMQRSRDQYQALRGEPYRPPTKRPIYLGAIAEPAFPFLRYSADRCGQSNRKTNEQ